MTIATLASGAELSWESQIRTARLQERSRCLATRALEKDIVVATGAMGLRRMAASLAVNTELAMRTASSGRKEGATV